MTMGKKQQSGKGNKGNFQKLAKGISEEQKGYPAKKKTEKMGKKRKAT